MRIATYNVEWFNSLFDDAGQLLFLSKWTDALDLLNLYA